jgi:hypothetical protein
MPRFEWLDDEQLIQDRMYSEVPAATRELLDQVRQIDGGLPLLRFLAANSNKLMSIDDIAYHLDRPLTQVGGSLAALVKIDVARWLDFAGHAFFGLTANVDRRKRVDSLVEWQAQWHQRVARIEQVLNGPPEERQPGNAARLARSGD